MKKGAGAYSLWKLPVFELVSIVLPIARTAERGEGFHLRGSPSERARAYSLRDFTNSNNETYERTKTVTSEKVVETRLVEKSRRRVLLVHNCAI